MSAERKVGFVERNFRGMLAASMLLIAPDAGPPPANQFGQVKRAEAAGLVQPQEQEIEIDWETWDKVVAQVATPIEAQDVASIRKLLSTDGFLDWTYNLQPSPRSKSIEETTNLFKKSFETRGAPSCVGYKWEMAAIAVLFDNLGVINNPEGSGYAIVYLSINAQKVPRISFVSEVPKDRLEIEKRSIVVVDLPPGAKVKLEDETVLRLCRKTMEIPKITSRQHIALVPGMLTFIDETGIEVNGRFSPLRERLAESDFAYRFSDYTVVGYTGGYIDNRGNYIAKRQSCEDTLQSLDVSGQNVAEMIVGWLKAHPNDTLILVGHSLGGPVVLRALEIIRDKNPAADLKRVKIITTHAPNNGIDKPILDILGQLLPQGLPVGCQVVLPIIGRTPPPQILDYPASRELLAMWDKREQRGKQLGELVSWFKGKGGEIFALGNWQDCVIAIRACGWSPFDRYSIEFEWMLFDWRGREVLLTQEIRGAVNIFRYLGYNSGSGHGHTEYYDNPEGLEILAAVIGKQNK